MISASPLPHVADRLIAAIERKRSPACIGLDPVVDRLPLSFRSGAMDAASAPEALRDFCVGVIDAVSPHVPCIKFQSACFERYRYHGALQATFLVDACEVIGGIEVILDAKRGDIGISAEHYAAAAFDLDGSEQFRRSADWITINSYLGDDAIAPFLREGHGAFALVRTSNPGGDHVQNLELRKGGTVAHAVGEMIARMGADHVGERGYSSLGAVVGATKPRDAERLREIMPQQVFLVPGYGAQGGAIDDVLPCFRSDGSGAIVSASRSVIYAFDPDDPNWAHSVADAAAKFADDVGRAVGLR